MLARVIQDLQRVAVVTLWRAGAAAVVLSSGLRSDGLSMLWQALTTPDAGAPYCPVLLPQGPAEEDEAMAIRLQLQAGLDDTLVPYNPKFETLEEYTERLS